jgi:excinuclease ABC subunit A
MKAEEPKFLSVRGARTHNLKNINIDIPRRKIAVITGLSGSGKSSLAFDTIFAEGQRRYVESLSSYARQFINQLSKPDVDRMDGLSPAISITQKVSTSQPRSTVGTVTEIYDFLRLLFARIGTPYCIACNTKIESQTSDQIVDRIKLFPIGSKLIILAPIVRDRKGEYKKELDQLRQNGFVKVRIDGKYYDLSEEIQLERHKRHTIDAVIDRLKLKEGSEDRLHRSVNYGLQIGDGLLRVDWLKSTQETQEELYSTSQACPECGVSFPPLEPKLFSFNSPAGACSFCNGMGYGWFVEEDDIEELDLDEICEHCDGCRLDPIARCVKIKDRDISELSQFELPELLDFFKKLSLKGSQKKIAGKIQIEILSRIQFLLGVGLEYLTLHRPAQTLSGGETQRIRLATQLGSTMMGVLYVLDEPSIGLHPRDHHRLLDSLYKLKELGNSVLVVEHDRDTIECADYLVDLGPGAGSHGGFVTATGSVEDVKKNQKSLTGLYLTHKKKIAVPKQRRAFQKSRVIRLRGCKKHNLKNVDFELPLGVLNCVTGVSGSGKSTLVFDLLLRGIKRRLKGDALPHGVRGLAGSKQIDRVIHVNQKPIGRTPRSNPATYSQVFSDIRKLFAQVPEARKRGYQPGRFSFNAKEGRCEACEGNGMIRVKMHFLPDVFVDCDTCGGKRFTRETLDIHFRGKNIADVLAMTIEEALDFFQGIPQIKRKLRVLEEVGLGYLTLGQSATTLSGGEAQRLKLAKEIAKKSKGHTLYMLDEPTTGLHFEDIGKLIDILQRLVNMENTVIIIEHNLDIIKSADWVVDVGPEGGRGGGEIVASGTPETIAEKKKSLTGRALKKIL